MARKIEVEILGDSSSYQRALGQAQTKTSKFGAIAKTALIGGAAAGLYALGKAAKMGWDEYNQGAQVAAQTNAAIKSTGGVAGVTAGHVDKLAQSMLKLTGIDDEATASAENQLLTFTKIGDKGGIFDRATQAVADLATRLNGGAIPSFEQMNSTAITVGKGLNNPINGLTRLTRIGVEFTDKQKEQITALAESGKTMKAQKIILKALEQQYGGSAKAAGETFGGSLTKLKNRLDNFLGDLTRKAIPYLQRFIKWVGPHLSDAMEKAKQVAKELRQRWQELGQILHKHQDTVRVLAKVMEVAWKVAKIWIKWNILLYGTLIKVELWVLNVALAIGDKLVGAAKKVWGWIKDVAAVLKGPFKTGLDVVVGPILTLIGWLNTLWDIASKVAHVLSLIQGSRGSGAPTGRGGSGGRTNPNIPEGATGGRVGRTGLAIIHKGETLVPAGAGWGSGDIVLQVDGMTLLRATRRAERRYGARN